MSLLALNTPWCLPTTKESILFINTYIAFYEHITLLSTISTSSRSNADNDKNALFLFHIELSPLLPFHSLTSKHTHTNTYSIYIYISINKPPFIWLFSLYLFLLLLLLLLLGIPFPREFKHFSHCLLEALEIVINQTVLFKVILTQETYQD